MRTPNPFQRDSRIPRRLLTGVAASATLAAAIGYAATAAHADAQPTSSCAAPSSASTAPVATASVPVAAGGATASPTPSTSASGPTTPTGLTAVARSPYYVELGWSAATPGAARIVGYDVAWRPIDSPMPQTTSVDNVTTTVMRMPLPNTSYVVQVAARDATGNRSAWSTQAMVTTPAVVGPSDTVPPSQPANLTATDITPTGVKLTWSASTDNIGVIAYEVFANFGGCVLSRILIVTGTSTTVTYSATRNPSAIYTFMVAARDAAGNRSPMSRSVSYPAGASTASASSSSSTSPLACKVTYAHNAWAGGFVANITIASTAGTANGWSLKFTFGGDQQVLSAWNATVSQTGTTVTATNVASNAMISPTSTVVFGFQGSWRTSDTAPTGFILNGSTCTTD